MMNAMAPKAPTKTTPKDVFLHLFSILLLYLAAFHWALLFYQLIDLSFPDVLEYQYLNPTQYYGALRWAVATLIISVPVYVWTQWQLARDYQKSPEKEQLRIRKWLIYFTLFATALIIIGDLIAVLYQFLEGSLSVRFGLKVLVILAITGAIFFYYQWQLHKPLNHIGLKWFGLAITGLVIGSIAFSFVIAGSPQTQRLRRFDQERVEHLQQLQSQILQYWQLKEKLPSQLSELNDDISGYQQPLDPATKQEYNYTPKDALTFELCSHFDTEFMFTDSPQSSNLWEFNNLNWQHTAQQTCFERTIDPELYKTEGAPVPVIAKPLPMR